MSDTVFLLNQTLLRETASPGRVMLDILHDHHRLTGAKAVCREGDCGACLVLRGRLQSDRVVYQPVVSCLLPLVAAAGSHIVTIEGLNQANLTPIQQALVDEGAIQCGYCTPGLVLALTAFFLRGSLSAVDDALDAVAGQICRCTGYSGIERAVKRLCKTFDLAASSPSQRLRDCVAWGMVPAYFLEVAQRLASIAPEQAEPKPLPHTPSVIVGGGTDLWVHESLRPEDTIYLQSPVSDDDAVRLQDGLCRIDARTTLAQFGASPLILALLPSIATDIRLLASEPIRQVATIAGNLVNASPIADAAVMLLALDASVTLTSESNERTLALRDFFIAYKQTALMHDEVVASVAFAQWPGLLFSFEKVGKRTHLDIASVNSGLSIVVRGGIIERCHLAFGGVAPIPLYCREVSDYLTGRVLTADVVVEAAQRAQQAVHPISDVRGSSDYKRLLVRQLVYAHFLKLFPQVIDGEALHAAG